MSYIFIFILWINTLVFALKGYSAWLMNNPE